MENEDLKKQIDELFRLFRKVMEKYPPEDVPGMDKAQMEQLKAYLTQYDSIKDQFSVEMFGMMDNGMAKQFISLLTNKLREQLGEDADIDEVADHYAEYVEYYNGLSKKEKQEERDRKFAARIIEPKEKKRWHFFKK